MKQRNSNIQNNMEKTGILALSNFKIYYKDRIINTVW